MADPQAVERSEILAGAYLASFIRADTKQVAIVRAWPDPTGWTVAAAAVADDPDPQVVPVRDHLDTPVMALGRIQELVELLVEQGYVSGLPVDPHLAVFVRWSMDRGDAAAA